jgi:hypothetical protein
MHGLKLKKNSKANRRSYLAHVSLSWLGSLTNPPELSVRHGMDVAFMTNYFFRGEYSRVCECYGVLKKSTVFKKNVSLDLNRRQ